MVLLTEVTLCHTMNFGEYDHDFVEGGVLVGRGFSGQLCQSQHPAVMRTIKNSVTALLSILAVQPDMSDSTDQFTGPNTQWLRLPLPCAHAAAVCFCSL
jgi:hypothetical protein